MILNQCHHKNQFHTKVLVLLKSYLIHVHLKGDASTISSLRIYIKLFVEKLCCTCRIFRAIGCKLLYLLLQIYIAVCVGNPGSSLLIF